MNWFGQAVNDGIINSSAGELLQLGVAGVFIIALIFVAVVLYRQGNDKDKKIEALQQARVDDAKEITTKLKEPLAEQAELSKRIYDILLTNGTERRR